MSKMKTIKVLRIIADLYPAVYGGAPIHAHEMSKLQSKLNCDVEVLTCDYNRKSKYIAGDGYKIISHKAWISIYGNPIAPTIFSSLLKMRKKKDIFHAHDTLFFTTNLAALAKKFNSPPLVITTHGLNSQTAPLWMSDVYYSSIGRWTLNAADKIICYNDIEKEKVIKIGIAPEKIEIIPNGVDTIIFKPEKKVKNYFQILWVGRYKPGKDIETLIEAAKIILNKHDNIKFLLVGQGPLQNNIKMCASKVDRSDKIRFIDHISNDKMPDIYNESDIFVLPSID
jgi:glycogen(starch) synthase